MAMALAITECSSCNCNGSEWKVRLAQFVPPPSHPADHKNFSLFNAVNKHNFRRNGTWISAGIPALLTISATNSAAKLYVKLHGKIHEEHFISRLKFTWSHTQCQAKYGTRGGRVVFASYYKGSLYKGFEKSKFALQFDTAFHARDFLSAVQESLQANKLVQNEETPRSIIIWDESSASERKLVQNEETPRSIVIWDESSASERLTTHKARSSDNIGTVPSHESNTHTQEMHSSVETGHSQDFMEEQGFVSPLESDCPQLPPRFSTYLQDCNIPAQIETDKGKTESPHILPSILSDVKGSTIDLKSQVTACFLDPTFQDFISKVEKVWNELHDELQMDV